MNVIPTLTRVAHEHMGVQLTYDRGTGYYIGKCERCDREWVRVDPVDAVAVAARCFDPGHEWRDIRAACAKCGARSTYPGTVLWCPKCGWLDQDGPVTT